MREQEEICLDLPLYLKHSLRLNWSRINRQPTLGSEIKNQKVVPSFRAFTTGLGSSSSNGFFCQVVFFYFHRQEYQCLLTTLHCFPYFCAHLHKAIKVFAACSKSMQCAILALYLQQNNSNKNFSNPPNETSFSGSSIDQDHHLQLLPSSLLPLLLYVQRDLCLTSFSEWTPFS